METLAKSLKDARVLTNSLQALLQESTAVTALAVMPLIERAARLYHDLAALQGAIASEKGQP